MPSDKSACVQCGKTPPTSSWRRAMCTACYARFRGVSSTAGTRKYRSDPEKRERNRERSRRWKREHLGQPGLPKDVR